MENGNDVTIVLTQEETKMVIDWLSHIGFQGTGKELVKPVSMHLKIMAKIEKALKDTDNGDPTAIFNQ